MHVGIRSRSTALVPPMDNHPRIQSRRSSFLGLRGHGHLLGWRDQEVEAEAVFASEAISDLRPGLVEAVEV